MEKDFDDFLAEFEGSESRSKLIDQSVERGMRALEVEGEANIAKMANIFTLVALDYVDVALRAYHDWVNGRPIR